VIDTTYERTAPVEPSGAVVADSWSAESTPAPPVVTAQMETASESPVDSRRYVAVVSEVPGVEVFAEQQPAVTRPVSSRGGDRYATDFPILIVSAMLAGSTFLPWYKGPAGFGIKATGWASGTWGPIVAFLALGSFALIALRRLGVRVGLPVEESLLHEAAGWISLVGAVLMSRLRPGPQDLLSTAYGAWIAIGAGAVLIVLAGRMSPHAPLHVRPGWQKGRAGLIGVIVIGIVVAGSAVFGVTNNPNLQATGGVADPLTGSVRGKIPECAKGFPLPQGMKPQYGFGTGPTCQLVMTSTKSPTVLIGEFRTLLTSKNWKFTEDRQPGVFMITKPRCGTLVVVPANTGSTAAVGFSPCASPGAVPTGSSSP